MPDSAAQPHASATRTFLVVPCQPPVGAVFLDPAAVVSVEDGPDAERRAAIEAHELILAENPDCDRGYLESVYVSEIRGYSVWNGTADYAPGEWKCCGGNGAGGHSGYCPEREPRAD